MAHVNIQTCPAAQAILYGGLMEACIELGPENCPTFQTWGVADRYTGNWAGYNPYLFDYDLNPKLSYYSVVEALQRTKMNKKLQQE